MKLNVSEEERADILSRLRRAMLEDKPWRSPVLSFNVLAGIIRVPPMRMRTAMSDGGLRYCEYVNRFRLEEVRRILDADPGIRLQDAVLRAGFASKNAFSLAYGKAYGHKFSDDYPRMRERCAKRD